MRLLKLYEAMVGDAQGRSGGSELAIAFVGTLVPEEPAYQNEAYGVGGQVFQKGLALAFATAGVQLSIFSVAPIPTFPASRIFWVRGGFARLAEGPIISLLSFWNVTPLKQLSAGFSLLSKLVQWGWQNRQVRHRVVYSYNLSMPPGLFILLGARLARAKAVAWICDINLPGEYVPATWPFRLDYWLHRKLIPKFDGHIVVTDGMAREFLNGKHYLRMEGGLSEDVLAQTVQEPSRAGCSGQPFVITYTGGLDKYRGIRLLLQAFSLLPGDSYRLQIAGRGPLESEVKQAAARDPRIKFVGGGSFTEILALYRTTDVLVNLWESGKPYSEHYFPGKLMPYLASGVPVITTCTGNIREEYSRFSYTLDSEAPEALSDLIRHVASLPPEEREFRADEARAYMAANKTWNVQAQRMLAYLKDHVLSG